MSKWQDLHGDRDTANRDLDQMREEVAVSDDDRKVAVSDPPKTIRCIIERDFSDRYRKLGSGDFVDLGVEHHQSNAQRENSREFITRVSTLDSSRLKTHLEWKRQKEIEYVKKREAERLEEQRKKQDKLREEKEKRLKEKEREEKVREWQKQKAREKQERDREETVFKALEQEIKVVTQTIGKEKLIHEWIRLKNRQKQMEAEKKAELLKKEEESRALRQSLAEISYRQWKERIKTRKIVLPKNGYQIFGPKPVPVVKEDWNHDFTKGDTVDHCTSMPTPKSTTSMTLIRAPCVSHTDVCSESHHHRDLKKRSPSSCHLRIGKSKTHAENFNAGLPSCKNVLNRGDAPQEWKHTESAIIHRNDDPRRQQQSEMEKFTGEKGKSEKATNCYSFHEEKFFLRPRGRFPSDCCATEKENSKLFNNPMADMRPRKDRLNIYLKTAISDEDLESEARRKIEKPKKTKKKTVLGDNFKMFLVRGKDDATMENSKLLNGFDEKLSPGRTRISNRKIVDLAHDKKEVNRSVSREIGKKKHEKVGVREVPCLISRSYEKQCQQNRSSSKSIDDKSKKGPVPKSSGKQTKKSFATATVKNSESKKSKKVHCRRKFTPHGGDVSERYLKSESEAKNRKKTRMEPKSETILVMDSPGYTNKRENQIESSERKRRGGTKAKKEGRKED